MARNLILSIHCLVQCIWNWYLFGDVGWSSQLITFGLDNSVHHVRSTSFYNLLVDRLNVRHSVNSVFSFFSFGCAGQLSRTSAIYFLFHIHLSVAVVKVIFYYRSCHLVTGIVRIFNRKVFYSFQIKEIYSLLVLMAASWLFLSYLRLIELHVILSFTLFPADAEAFLKIMQ